jgi:hypothetical protein
VRVSGRPSWQITLDSPQVLAVALYLRDLAGVAQTAPPSELPEAMPSVAAHGTVQAPPQVAPQWNAWWTRALLSGPHALRELEPSDLPAFADVPELQDLLREHVRAALRWSADAGRSRGGTDRRGLPLGELVREVELGTGRTAGPFRLRLDVVPVVGDGTWTARHAHVLVPAGLLDEPELLVARLRPVVESLA